MHNVIYVCKKFTILYNICKCVQHYTHFVCQKCKFTLLLRATYPWWMGVPFNSRASGKLRRTPHILE